MKKNIKLPKLTGLKTQASKMMGKTGLKVQKYSPEILMGVGVVGVVASTVLACKATLKVEGVLDDAQEKIDKVKYAQENIEEDLYSETDFKKDMTLVYVQTGVEFAKIYGPAISLGVVSVGCLLGAHNIMKKRNVALAAAYKLAEQTFSDYRKRVVDTLGEDKDKEFRYGITQETIDTVEVDKDGKEKKVKKKIDVADPNGISQYAKFFDEASHNWSKTPEYNMVFLKCQQNFANDMLKAKGHIFLNEVYDMLGIERTQAGAIVGWVIGEGDNFVDFGMYDIHDSKKRDFVNGYERSILLDFNVDGVIYDLI